MNAHFTGEDAASTAFLLNCWYVAAWADELVQGALIERVILDRSVLLARRQDGEAVALSNRCPHRFAPLHMGVQTGNEVQCPYHGLRFDLSGACIHNPHGSGSIPDRTRLTSYPLVERYGMLWIWMGEQPPEPENIPDFGVLDQAEQYTTIKGVLTSDANYELVADNLMDLSHVIYVHGDLLGNEDMTSAEIKYSQDGNIIWARRDLRAIPPPELFALQYPPYRGMLVDQWQYTRWSPPSSLLIELGTHAAGQPDVHRTLHWITNCLTPIDARSTRYFWASSRDHHLNDAEHSERSRQGLVKAFETQDKPLIEAQQRMMRTTDLMSLQPILLETDGGPVRARRYLRKLIREEQRRA